MACNCYCDDCQSLVHCRRLSEGCIGAQGIEYPQRQPCGGLYCTPRRHRDCAPKMVADDLAQLEEERIIDRGQV